MPKKDLQAEIMGIISTFPDEKKKYVYKFVKALET